MPETNTEERREERRVGPIDRRHAPWQIKFAYAFGIPAVIAMYLVYYQTNRMDTTLSQLQNSIQELRADNRELQTEVRNNKEAINATERKYDRLLNIMIRVCVNAAEKDSDRNGCFEYAATSGQK